MLFSPLLLPLHLRGTSPQDVTIAPTSVPPSAIYYDSFEGGVFPEPGSGWLVDTSEGGGSATRPAVVRGFVRDAGIFRDTGSFRTKHVNGGRRLRELQGAQPEEFFWALSTDEAATGIYSIKSPDLDDEDGTRLFARTSLNTSPEWGGGTLSFSLLWDLVRIECHILLPFESVPPVPKCVSRVATGWCAALFLWAKMSAPNRNS